MSGAAARELLQRTGSHPVVSLYFDLDPDQFATAPARASQARALIDEAHRAGEDERAQLSHDDRATFQRDLQRVADYLDSDELPVSGARGLAVFCSGQDDLFETVALHLPTRSAAYVDRHAHVEPLVTAGEPVSWCAVLASSRTGRVFVGTDHQVRGHQTIEDYVRGRGGRGAASANTEAQDIEGHLIQLADAIWHDWQHRQFALLALGGPVEPTSRLRELLHPELRPALADEPLDLDDSAAGEVEVRDAMGALLDRGRGTQATEALTQLGNTTRAVRGVTQTLEALNEQRVQTLIFSRDFSAEGGSCANDGMLVESGTQTCPADGSAVEPVVDLREAMVRVAVGQAASVIALHEPHDELGAAHPVAALLRF